jgi:hypothetical protein
MRVMWNSIVFALSFGLVACGGEDDAESTDPAAAEATATAVAPLPNAALAPTILAKIGGSIVAAGDFFVEVLPLAGGHLEALVLDGEGEPVAAGASVTVAVKGSDSAVHPVSLSYDAERGSYAGELEGELAIVPGPVEVTVEAGGATGTGRFESLAVAPVPSHGGAVLVAGAVAAEVAVEPEGAIHAYFVDAAGAPVTGDIEGQGKVVVFGTDGAPHPADLRWDAEAGHHVGRLDAEFTVAPGPVELVVDVRGASHRGRIERAALLRPAVHGGQVAVAGEYSVEVVPTNDGYVDAYVVDFEGAPVRNHASFVAHVGADLAPVRMTWNGQAGCYRGRVGADVDVSVRPVEVVLVGRGRRHYGGVAVVRPAVAAPRGRVVVEAEAPARPSVSVRANAGTAASAGASVRGPAAQVRVGVSVPRPPSVSVRAGVSAGAGAGGSAMTERRRSGASAGGGVRAGAGIRFGN